RPVPGRSRYRMAAGFLAARPAEIVPHSEWRSNVRNSFVAVIAAALIALPVAQGQTGRGRGGVPAICNQDQASTLGAPPADRSGCPGPRQGPPGPVPRLSDGHPDLSGVWNGFGGSGGQGATQPWAAKIVAEHRAKGGAEDFEA